MFDTRTTPASQLLAAYRPGDSLFASPTRTVLATGEQLRLDLETSGEQLDVQVARLLEESGVELVLAAVPYDAAQPARVVVPESLHVAEPLSESRRAGVSAELPTPKGAPHSWQISARPSRAAYADSVTAAVERIDRGALRKVVLARSLDLTGAQADPVGILGRLARHDPNGYTYALDLPPTSTGVPRRLVGASPELLVARTGRRVVARPEAGSAARATDPVEDDRRGAALLASAKELAEHAFVVEAVVESLSPYCRDVSAPARPTLMRTATMWHLLTEVTGELLDPSISSLTLALALHPTPAVCGTPAVAAQEAIDELEGFHRGFYAGFVGWCDATGDGEWAITLRCAELRADSLRLYGGAGVVSGSDPHAEVAETGAKFSTMLNAMGIAYDG